MPPQPQVSPSYSPVPGVRPQGPRDPSERVHIDFPNVRLSGAVGEAMATVGRQGYGTLARATQGVADSLDNLGTQLERTGEKLWQRAVGLQELQLETDVKKRELEYETWLGEKNAQFSQLQGEAASEATLKAHIKEVEEKRNKMGENLPLMGKKMWDRVTHGSLVSSVKGAASHAATETRKAALGASDARVALKTDQFAKEDDIKRSEQLFEEARREFFDTKAPLHGWTPDKAEAEWNKTASKMYSSKIARLADSDAKKAWDMLQENKHLFEGDDYTRVSHTVMTAFRQQYGRNIANEIQDKNPDASLEDKRKKVEERANQIQKETGISDPLLADYADQRLMVEHDRRQKEQKEEYAKNANNAKDAAYGYEAPGGRKPTTIEEFYAIPGAKEAYDALKPGDKHTIDQILLHNLKDDYPRTRATRDRMNALLGEAQSTNPSDRENFMLRNFHEEKIPGEDRDKLMALQRKMRADVYKEDPHLSKGFRIVSDMLPENVRSTTKSPATHKAFVGAFYQAISTKLEENKGVPLKADEYREIAAQLLREMPGTGWFGTDYGRQPLYKTITEPSNADMTQMKNQFPYATEQQLKDAWIRMKWQNYSKEYEKLKSIGQGTATPAAKPAKPAPPATVPQSQ